jgi:Rrf2 family protein
MQMSLGKRADYAIRAVLDMAKHWPTGQRRKSRDIAAEMGIPAKYLPQVLAALVRGGLIDSGTGPDGGYRLASPPDTLTLLEVVEAVEGPLKSTECVLRGGPCHWDIRCAIHESWAGAQEAMRQRLRESNFGDLARVDSVLERHGL